MDYCAAQKVQNFYLPRRSYQDEHNVVERILNLELESLYTNSNPTSYELHQFWASDLHLILCEPWFPCHQTGDNPICPEYLTNSNRDQVI